MSDCITSYNNIYTIKIIPKALKEWNNLDSSIKKQLSEKLKKLRWNPITNNTLSGLKGCYKIKLRRAGYRLVYQVIQGEIIIVVWAVNKREENIVYDLARERLEAFSVSDAVALNLNWINNYII